MIWDGRSSPCRTALIATCPAASRWIDRADGTTALVPPPRLLIAIAATVIVLGVSAVAWGRDGLVLVALVTIPGLAAFGLALGFWRCASMDSDKSEVTASRVAPRPSLLLRAGSCSSRLGRNSQGLLVPTRVVATGLRRARRTCGFHTASDVQCVSQKSTSIPSCFRKWFCVPGSTRGGRLTPCDHIRQVSWRRQGRRIHHAMIKLPIPCDATNSSIPNRIDQPRAR